ncbi:MAG: pyruvate kinase [Clostridia bacterium]|nr:pyruvate kinase [Clostridia bacterium]
MSCITSVKKTKIICSIGPSSTAPEVMSKMVEAGMNVARINFSHATLEEKIAVVDSVHKVREMTGKNIAILYDTKGPEFRSGMTETGEIKLEEGKTIRMVKESVLGNEERFSVNHPQAIDNLDVGSIVLLENGLMKIQVISVEDDGVTCKIINGGVLGNKKSLNAPGVKLDIPFISDVDREDIIYACEHEGDYLALSFVSCKEDVLEARAILKECNREDLKIISKIESTTGVENLDSIIDVSDGIMVARGDLGVEVPMQQLPKYQKLMIEKCREKGKMVVVATEMLESMKKSARPTRAEVSDVANAVLDGTDAVMLSGETTVGKFPVEVVRYMAEICKDTEEYYDYDYEFGSVREADVTETIANSVVNATSVLGVDYIIAATESGETARRISNLKPRCLVLAITYSEEVAHKLALNYAVYPVVVKETGSIEEFTELAKEKVKEVMGAKVGDMVAITGGFPKKGAKQTNFLKIEQL